MAAITFTALLHALPELPIPPCALQNFSTWRKNGAMSKVSCTHYAACAAGPDSHIATSGLLAIGQLWQWWLSSHWAVNFGLTSMHLTKVSTTAVASRDDSLVAARYVMVPCCQLPCLPASSLAALAFLPQRHVRQVRVVCLAGLGATYPLAPPATALAIVATTAVSRGTACGPSAERPSGRCTTLSIALFSYAYQLLLVTLFFLTPGSCPWCCT